MKKMLFIINPRAGKAEMKTKLMDVVDIFVKGGYSVTVLTTQRPLDATKYVVEMASNYNMLVACGGDGTLSEIVNGLMQLEKKPILGYIPQGTVNDFALSLKLPLSPLDAALEIITGAEYKIDVGVFNKSRYFSYVAAFGAFTDIPYSTPQNSKNLFGRAAYILEGLMSITNIKPVVTNFTYNGKSYKEEVIIGMISNSSSVAGIQLTHFENTSLSDGLLEVTLVRNPKTMAASSEIVATVITGDFESAQNSILTFQTDSINFEFEDEIAWTLDGEYGDTVMNATIGILPKALSIVSKNIAPILSNNNHFH